MQQTRTPPQFVDDRQSQSISTQSTQSTKNQDVKKDTCGGISGFDSEKSPISPIAVAFIGEGTLGEGTVYEAANLISKWELPVLIIIENNRFSQSTPQEITIAGEILDRFSAFGINTFDTDTWDLQNLYETLGAAVEYVRSGKPTAVRIQTDRLMAHSKGDDDRPKELVESYYERDVITAFSKAEPEKYKEYLAEAEKRIDAAVEAAEKAPLAKPHILPQHHRQTVTWKRLTASTNSPTLEKNPKVPKACQEVARSPRINEIIRDCFAENMAKDERIIMLGEDILDPYGGSFKATKGLSTAFPDKVRGTSISEAAIIGIGNGLSLAGKLPVCEIMFGDFMTLTFDQILNHAAKFPLMYNGQVENPIIIRTPMGGGRGYGPTHSQSIEKHFLGIPQLLVLALNQRVSPANIYNRLFAELKQPVLVIENKMLYAKRLKIKDELGFVTEVSDELYPTVRIRPVEEAEGAETRADLTIACYGGMLEFAEEAQQKLFDDHDVIAEIVCPTQLYPLNIVPILESVRKTGRLLTVEEGVGFAAWGSEVVTQIMEAISATAGSTQGLSQPCVKRLNMPECPIPCCGPLEKELLPNTASVIKAALETTLETCGHRETHGGNTATSGKAEVTDGRQAS